MKELEEHLRAITEQVKIRRKLLTEIKNSVKYIFETKKIRFLKIYLLDIGD